MRVIAQTQADSIENLIEQFAQAQKEASACYENLIEAARTVQGQGSLYEEIIANSRDAIFVAEEDSGIIRHVNEAAEDLLGYSHEDLCGRRQDTLFPEDQLSYLKTEYSHLHEGSGLSRLRSCMIRADGSQVHVSLSVNALPHPFEGLIVGFVRDISNQVNVEEDLRALNETLEKRVDQRTQEIQLANEELKKAISEANRNAVEAEEANQAKSLFLANMTHEVRTPLNAVVGLLDLLLDMDLGEKEKETAQVISRSAKVLGGIINDILDFSKIDAGKLELEKVVFVLPDLINQIIETFSFQAQEKDISLELEWEDGLPEFVVGDPGRLRQVLINLVSNALKFTEKGGVVLEVTKVSLEGRRQSIAFAVRDTGVGICGDKLEAIFEPFVQADATITRKFGGTGLGLNIAAKLVAKMGGNLEVDSAEGQGSCFFFTANFARASEIEIEAQRSRDVKPEPVPEREYSSLQVLLAEDNKLNQRVAQGMLAKLGYRTDLAETGNQVLEMMSGKTYDLVFMDVQMPGMDGLEAVGKIRQGKAGEANRHVPVIAMTAHASRDDRKMCLAAGMTDYVPKPISTELISQAIGRVLEPAAAGDEDQSQAGFSLDAMVAKTGGDENIAAEVLDLFMVEARKKVNLIIGALQNYDFDFAANEAQHLESKARNVHANSIAALTRDLVQAADAKQQDKGLYLAEDIRAQLREMESVI